MKDLPQTTLAYIAGFFDGEGSVTIGRSPSGSGQPNHTLVAAIGNTNQEILVWAHSLFGGHLCLRKRNNPKWKDMLQWSLQTCKALAFLEAIRPYLRVKAQVVDVAIAYQRTKYMSGGKKLSRETIQWRDEQRDKIRELNDRHPKKEFKSVVPTGISIDTTSQVFKPTGAL